MHNNHAIIYWYLWAPDYWVMPKYDRQLDRTQFSLKRVRYMTAEANITVSHWTFVIQLANMSAIMSLLKHVVLAINKNNEGYSLHCLGYGLYCNHSHHRLLGDTAFPQPKGVAINMQPIKLVQQY